MFFTSPQAAHILLITVLRHLNAQDSALDTIKNTAMDNRVLPLDFIGSLGPEAMRTSQLTRVTYESRGGRNVSLLGKHKGSHGVDHEIQVLCPEEAPLCLCSLTSAMLRDGGVGEGCWGRFCTPAMYSCWWVFVCAPFFLFV